MTREDRLAEIDDYVRYLDAVHADVVRSLDPRAVSVTAFGFSQGTATASRWAALGAARIDRLILWGGEVPPDLDLTLARDRLKDATLMIVAGTTDPYVTEKILMRDSGRLEAARIPFQLHRFEGGHEIPAEVLRRFAV